jgi:hypothetical protein
MHRPIAVLSVIALLLTACAIAECPIKIEFSPQPSQPTPPGEAHFVLHNLGKDEIRTAWFTGYWQNEGFAPSEFDLSGGPIPASGERTVDVPLEGAEKQILRAQRFRGVVIQQIEFTDGHMIRGLAQTCQYFATPLLPNQRVQLTSAIGTISKPEVLDRTHPKLPEESLEVTRVQFDPDGKKRKRVQLEFCGNQQRALEQRQGWLILEYMDTANGCSVLVGARAYKTALDKMPEPRREECREVRLNGTPGCGYRGASVDRTER